MNDTLFVCGTCGSAFWEGKRSHADRDHMALLGQAAAFQGRHWDVLRKDRRVSPQDRRQKWEIARHQGERREEGR